MLVCNSVLSSLLGYKEEELRDTVGMLLVKDFKTEKKSMVGCIKKAEPECIKFVKCGLLELPSVHKFMAPKALKEYILSFKGALVPCGAERNCWRVKV